VCVCLHSPNRRLLEVELTGGSVGRQRLERVEGHRKSRVCVGWGCEVCLEGWRSPVMSEAKDLVASSGEDPVTEVWETEVWERASERAR
jgi:hypothetical protein